MTTLLDAWFSQLANQTWEGQTTPDMDRRSLQARSQSLHDESQVLSFVEGATPAIYHACPSTLRPLDELFHSFLDNVEISSAAAILHHRLAPLCMRPDVAKLGLLHKVSLRIAPRLLLNLLGLQPQDLFLASLLIRPTGCTADSCATLSR